MTMTTNGTSARPAFVQRWVDDLLIALLTDGVTRETRDVYLEGVAAILDEREISLQAARVFASWYHDGSRVALAFVSTGTLPIPREGIIRVLFPEGVDSCTSAADRAMFNLFGTFVLNADYHG